MRPLPLALALSLSASVAAAQDSDGDGVLDAADRFPCDGAAAAEIFAPAEGQHALLFFEDQWPNQGDLDFNDLVLAHSIVFLADGTGAVVALRATFDVLAVGGEFTNGLGWRLPVPRAQVSSVQVQVGGSPAAEVAPRAADGDLVVTLTPSLRVLFAGASGPINSLPSQAALPGHVMEVEVRFATPQALDTSLAPFDVFIFRSDDLGHEVHAIDYPGTASMRGALFGASDDRSGGGRWFVDGNGLPFVLSVPTSTDYPAEGVAISTLFPRITAWASSGGATDTDYYTTSAGVPAAYRPSAGTMPSPRFGPSGTNFPRDTACLPANYASCSAALQAGFTQDGVYTVDPDGVSGPVAPVDVYCDMTTDGGGWTLVHKNDKSSTADRQDPGVNVAALTSPTVNTVAKLPRAAIEALGTSFRLVSTTGERFYWRGIPYHTTDVGTAVGPGPYRFRMSYGEPWLRAGTYGGGGGSHGPCIGGVGSWTNTPGYEHLCIQRWCCGSPNAGFWLNGGTFSSGRYHGGAVWVRDEVPTPTYSSCLAALQAGNTQSGRYAITFGGTVPNGSMTYCDMTTDGGGWTLIHKTNKGSTGDRTDNGYNAFRLIDDVVREVAVVPRAWIAATGSTFRIIRSDGRKFFWRGGVPYYTTDSGQASTPGPHEYKFGWSESWLPASTAGFGGGSHGPCVGGVASGSSAAGHEHVCIQRWCCGGPNAGFWFNGGRFSPGHYSGGTGWVR